MKTDAIAGMRDSAAAISAALTDEYLNRVRDAATMLRACLMGGHKILVVGNGGSAADAQHIAAELLGRFKRERRALPAIALTTDSSMLTAWSNDCGFETVFSRQLEGLGAPGDVLWGISTSGNSPNVVRAFEAARERGMKTLGLLGRDGGQLAPLCDCAVIAPLTETDQIQTLHQLSYHAICAELDHAFD